jgi:hypothetical protein
MRIGRTLLLVAISGPLLVGGFPACSSDDDGSGDAAETPLGQALTEQLLSGAAVNTEEEARCVAGTTVEAIGEDRLAELGVTPDDVSAMGGADFTDDEIDTLVDAFFDCVDMRQVIATNLAADAGEEAADCLAENLPDDALRDIVRAFNFEGQELPAESEQALRDTSAACGVPVD